MPKNSPTRFTWVPARRSNEATATKRVRRILIVLTIAAIMGPLSFLFVLAKGEPVLDTSSLVPEGRAVADAAAYQFLTGQPVSVPAANTLDLEPLRSGASGPVTALPYPASSITWDSFERHTFGGSDGRAPVLFEVHSFLVVPSIPEASGARTELTPEQKEKQAESNNATPEDALLVPQELQVSVLLTQDGPRLAAAPAFAPWDDASKEQGGIADYSDLTSGDTAEVPSQVVKQISVWANAYATDDRQALLTVTGDSDPNHTYLGLGGFTVAAEGSQVQILSASNAGPDRLLLRVRVRMQETTTTATVAEGQAPYVSVQDFDVLVASPNNAQPAVQAWGPAGSASTMVPYGNAFTK